MKYYADFEWGGVGGEVEGCGILKNVLLYDRLEP